MRGQGRRADRRRARGDRPRGRAGVRAITAAIDAALSSGDFSGAAALAEAALAAGERSAMLLNLAAWAREEQGDLAGALWLLGRGLAESPDDPSILTGIGAVLRKEGRLAEALRALRHAITVSPSYAAPWLEQGYALESGGSLALAAESFARAAALDPGLGAAYAGMAAVATRTGDHIAAREAATLALAIDPDDPAAIRALAAAEMAGGDTDSAIRKLDAMLARALAPADRIAALTLRGDARDKGDDPPGAVADWEAANTAFTVVNGTRRHGTQAEWLDGINDAVARVKRWTPVRSRWTRGQAKRHVVLTGYPRSGTTLVENILASAPGVAALEERPTLAEADRAFLEDPGRGIPALALLDDPRPWREAYWRRVAAAGATAPTLVDMDPMKSARLPLFARLFPEARIVIMRRDPRDVVLSCFRTSFAPSGSALDLTTLPGAARHYDAAMRLIDRCTSALQMTVHELRYDRLIADFDGATRALFGFCGIGWTPAVRDFASTARRRGVATASAGQVRRGLYDGGGQWRRYERELAPIMPILEPWVEKLGFTS